MSHKAIFVQPGGGYERVIVGTSEAARPEAGEITVRLRAKLAELPRLRGGERHVGPSEPRIPMADGAGEVVAVGSGVTEFAVGDARESAPSSPTGWAGEPLVEGFATVPGDGVDGYAREMVTARATSFTHAPKGYTVMPRRRPDHRRPHCLACADGRRQAQAGDSVLIQGTGGVSIFALQFAKMAGATVIATSSSDAKLERSGRWAPTT